MAENGEERKDIFWKSKRVFITGHTGFKGSWLVIWLHLLGAKVHGYSLQPPTEPSLYKLCDLERLLETSTLGDVRDSVRLKAAVAQAKPEIVIHMAAQPLVQTSYSEPLATYAINVMGTVHLLEAVRSCPSVRAVLNVTTDKCYDDKDWVWGYREHEALGGYDPYSSSKACSELVTAAYRSSYFPAQSYDRHRVAVASARAGNVIGGGDWANNRLVPDIMRALLSNEKPLIRNPDAVRPWQHVLEPLRGYLLLCRLLYEHGAQYAEPWNFGPNEMDVRPVRWIVERLCGKWEDGGAASFVTDLARHPHEARYLKLDCSKAINRLNWTPRWSLDRALDEIVAWTKAYEQRANMYEITCRQIAAYGGL
jgi:CDP-glucose 4,6-dehydratase